MIGWPERGHTKRHQILQRTAAGFLVVRPNAYSNLIQWTSSFPPLAITACSSPPAVCHRPLFSFPISSPTATAYQTRVNSSTISVVFQLTTAMSTIALPAVYHQGPLPLFDHSGHHTAAPCFLSQLATVSTSPKPLGCFHALGEIDIILGPDWMWNEASQSSSNFGNSGCHSREPTVDNDITNVSLDILNLTLSKFLFMEPRSNKVEPTSTSCRQQLWFIFCKSKAS